MDVGFGLDVATGVLSLEGNGENDSVFISQPTTGVVRVQTLNGTEFEGGGTLRQFNASQVDRINVNLGTGLNTLSVGTIRNIEDLGVDSPFQGGRTNVFLNGSDFTGSVSVRTSDLSETIQIRNSDIDQLSINSRGGHDNVLIDNVRTNGQVSVITESGRDVVTVEDSNIGTTTGSRDRPLTINTGDDQDQVAVVRTNVNHEMNVNLGGGPIENSVRQSLTVSDSTTDRAMNLSTTGGGAFVTVINSDVGTASGVWDLNVNTSSGWDQVNITNVDVDDDLRISTNGGVDTIDINNVKVGDDVSIAGGEQSDTIDLYGVDADDIYLYGQGSTDTMILRNVKVTDYLYANLGSGNDTFRANGGITFGRASINGDSGTNDDFEGWLGGASVYGFER